MTQPASGQPRVFVPVITPFTADLAVDTRRFVGFCKWLVSQRAGLAVFGTNSEANSLSLAERLELLDALVDGGIDPRVLMPGTGSSALPDAVALTRHAVRRGCGGALVLPPFFYKGVAEDGVYRYYSEIIEKVGSAALQLYLYHIPQVSGVPITLSLIARLREKYPKTVVGIKDSSGDWENTRQVLEQFPGFQVFPASEALLQRALPLGAAGCISATANLQPGTIADYIDNWSRPDAERLNARLSAVRLRMQSTTMIPALKAVVAHHADDQAWLTVRPPLSGIAPSEAQKLVADLAALGFEMPGLGSHVH
jgi:4-hydroxy-tetrahydrodipicolinate synthase